MAVIDDVRELVDEQFDVDLIPDTEPADCLACGAESTNDHPVLRVRVVDYDGAVFPRMCSDCLAGLAAHHRRAL